MNKEWHAQNRMPKNPTLTQRLDWHVEHAKNCQCREMPTTLKEEMKKRRLNVDAIFIHGKSPK